MINLLPPDFKQDVTFARRNRLLLNWVTATFVGIAGIAVVIAAGLFYIDYQTNAYAQQVDRTKASLAQQELEATQARIGEIDSSVQLALQVLSKEIPFSKLIEAIGSVIPEGAALQNLSIGDVEGALDLQVIAVDYQTATQVQVNIEDPENGVFQSADINNITCTSATADDGPANPYPCQVSIRALFAEDSPYLLSNEDGS